MDVTQRVRKARKALLIIVALVVVGYLSARFTEMNAVVAAEAAEARGDYAAAATQYRRAIVYAGFIRTKDSFYTQHSRTKLAAAMVQLGQLDEAVEMLAEVRKEQLRNAKFESESLLVAYYDFANVIDLADGPKAALPWRHTVLEIARNREFTDTLNLYIALRDLALNYLLADAPADALPLAEEAFEILPEHFSPADDEWRIATSTLIRALRGTGRYHESVSVAQEAYDNIRAYSGEDDPTTLSAMGDLVMTLSETGELETALEMQIELTVAYRARYSENDPKTVEKLSNLAAMYGRVGNDAKALELMQTVFEQMRRIHGPDNENTLIAMLNLAVTYSAIDREAEALKLLEPLVAARLRVNGPDHSQTLRAKSSLASTYVSMNRIQDAIDLHRDILTVRTRVLGEDHPDAIRTKVSLAAAMKKIGVTDEVLALEEEALASYRKNLGSAHERTLRLIGAMALTKIFLGLVDEAISLGEEALELASKTLPEEHPYFASINGQLALSHLLAQNPWDALDFSRQHLEARARLGAGYVNQTDDVIRQFESASRGSSALFANIALFAADVELRGAAPETSLEVLSRPENTPVALFSEAFEAIQTVESEAGSALSRAGARLAAGDTKLEELARDWDEARQMRQRLEQDYSALLIASGTQGTNAPDVLTAAKAELKALSGQITAMETELAEEYPRFFELIEPQPVSVAELRGEIEGQAALLGENEALVLLSPPAEAYTKGIVWAVTRERIAWAILGMSQDELEHKLKKLHAQLDITDAARGAFVMDATNGSTPVRPFDRQLSYELYKELFGAANIQAVIADKPHLILAPQGMLLSLPFATLVTAPPPGGPEGDTDPQLLRQTEWLGLTRSLSVVPAVSSIRTLRALVQQDTGSGMPSLFGVGDPDFQGGQSEAAGEQLASVETFFRGAVANPQSVRSLARLPGTRREIEALAGVFDQPLNDARILLGNDANETNLFASDEDGRLSDANVVVFATHGLVAGAFKGLAEPALALTPPECGPVPFDPIPGFETNGSPCSPTTASTALEEAAKSGARIDDGLLTASEAAGLRLNADWVVLSACDTAAGADQSPDAEGLSGLARSFFYAGARSVLVSHWPVRDDVAARLSPDAISRASSSVSQAEALRQAMQALVNDESLDGSVNSFAHPSAWAPFQVTGVHAQGH